MRSPLVIALALGMGAGAAGAASAGAAGPAPGRLVDSKTLPPALQASVSSRTGPEQNRLELVKTSRLNVMGGLGFSGLQEIRPTGSGYVARVRTPHGDQQLIDIDTAAARLDIYDVDPVAALYEADPVAGVYEMKEGRGGPTADPVAKVYEADPVGGVVEVERTTIR